MGCYWVLSHVQHTSLYFFSTSVSGTTTAKILQLCTREVYLGYYKNFSAKRVVKCWKRQPEGVVESPSPEIFRKGIDVVLKDML